MAAEGNASVGLRYIQIGNEATPGTAVAATEILLGNLTWPADDYVVKLPEGEQRNSMAKYFANAFEVSQIANFAFEGDVIFRHLIYWLSMALRGNITATQPDSTNQPNAYLWTFEPSLSARNTPDETNGIDTFTIEFGDDKEDYEVPYCFATHIEISGAPNEVCRVSVDITGQKKDEPTKTGGLSVQSVQRAPFNLSKYYRDTSWATMVGGSPTQKTKCFKGFTWAFDTMFTPRFTGDGNLYFASVDEDVKAPTLELILVRGTESEVLRDAFEAQTTIYPGVKLLGATELDSAQTNMPYLEIHMAGVITSWPAPGEDQGLATIAVPITAVYDASGAKQTSLKVLNSLSAFPT